MVVLAVEFEMPGVPVDVDALPFVPVIVVELVVPVPVVVPVVVLPVVVVPVVVVEPVPFVKSFCL